MDPIFVNLQNLWDNFCSEHHKAKAGNKAAARRARQASIELRKKLTEYKAKSLESEK